MGEATYYLKARFCSEEEAARIEPEFRKLLDDLVAFNNDWQAIREDRQRSCAERLADLRRKYPSLKDVLKDHSCKYPPDASMNCLAGPLPDINADYGLRQSGRTLRLANYVWHLTEWDALVRWIRARGGKASYLSDEYVDYFRLL